MSVPCTAGVQAEVLVGGSQGGSWQLGRQGACPGPRAANLQEEVCKAHCSGHAQAPGLPTAQSPPGGLEHRGRALESGPAHWAALGFGAEGLVLNSDLPLPLRGLAGPEPQCPTLQKGRITIPLPVSGDCPECAP